MPRLMLSINSDLEDVSLLAVAINRICFYLGLGSPRSNEAELCVVEAVTNVIRHAYHGEPGHAVEVAVRTGTDSVIFEIRDNGTPMTTKEAEVLTDGTRRVEFEPLNREALAEGGRGLQIIHDLMDEIAYAADGERNRLTLTKRIYDVIRE
ncbi:ATP-binding protein [Acidicapsa acidisoli]|uniref:ATP-binding protein n=1 Tax=Acidicapsa acidisoli TaxID=1615681 RepID=UPI0021E07214|nr:ATP-binding protein [Acidicapsa acidisoli]